jgi:plasmid stabilization system protein ParE
VDCTVIYSEAALADLREITAFIAADNVKVAEGFANRLVDLAESLRSMPERGPTGEKLAGSPRNCARSNLINARRLVAALYERRTSVVIRGTVTDRRYSGSRHYSPITYHSRARASLPLFSTISHQPFLLTPAVLRAAL